MENKEIVVVTSGGFDPVHIAHLRMFKEAKKLGDKLVIILNNDNWLKKKKGYAFMNQEDRKEILLGFECVDNVIISEHPKNSEDMSVCKEIKELKPDIFANGGDRKKAGSFEDGDVPEYTVCNELGIKMIFNVGPPKIRSSSELIKKAKQEELKSKKNI